MRKFTRILPVLMIAILSIFFLANQGKAQTTLLTEGWESATNGSNTPPAGWGLDVILGSNITYYMSVGTWPTVNPFEGSRLVDFESFSYSSGTNRLKRTTAISTVGYSNISVDFEWYTDNGYAGTTLEGAIVQWSTNGTTWTDAGTTWMRYAGTNQWVLNTQALPVGAANQPTLYVAFQFNSQFGDDCHLDIMHVKGLQTGTLIGNVTNCLTAANLNGATVTITAGSPPAPYSTTTNAAGNYTILAVPVGIWPVTATLPLYQNYGPASASITANNTTTLNFCMYPLPAAVSGVVTNAATGAPVIGAYVYVNTTPVTFTYSTGPTGAYTLNIYTAYTGVIHASKDGFNPYTGGTTVTWSPPNLYPNTNIPLLETANPASQPFTAVLNSGQTQVNLNWGIPKGNYQLIYDNGVETGFAIWQAATNLDAVKFTPAGYPATLLGCMINIGKSTDYTLPGHPVTFMVGVFDATGAGGMPGNQLVAYQNFVVTSTVFGWYDYPAFFGAGVTINSGSIYIVTKQVGDFPNAAGIALDTTAIQLRSFQKFVTGSGPWLPAGGNLMIRAHMYGAGGPFLLGDNPENNQSIQGYQVWRLLQGQESLGPVGWSSIGTPTATNISDGSWPSLPCQSYRWAVETQYTNNRWSGPTFSNALGKCWTANVTVIVTLSCNAVKPNGAVVTLNRHNPGTPPPTYDSIYVKVTDTSGIVHFTNIYKGVYDLVVTDLQYSNFTQTNITIMGDMTLGATLLQIKTPPPTPPGLILYSDTALGRWRTPIGHAHDPCLLGYDFYLNNAISGFTTDTFYYIPSGQLLYGATFQACVAAIYGSGYSAKVCTTFVSHFLCPVTNLTATAQSNAAYLTWTKPQCLAGQNMCFIYDDGTMENGLYFNPGYTEWAGNKFIINTGYSGQITSFNLLWWNNAAATTQPFQIDVFNLAGVLIGSSQTFTVPNPAPSTFMTVTLTNPIPFTGQFYGMVKWSNFSGATHFLGMDQNGPYVNSGVGMWYDGTTWNNASALGYGACVWTVRACAFVIGADNLVTLGPEPDPELILSTTPIAPGIAVPVSQSPLTSVDSHDYSITTPYSPSATGLVGYNAYQNIGGSDINPPKYVPGPDSLSTYMFNLNPGHQCFDVKAKYDLSVYGFAGQFGESLGETPGPVCLDLVFGYPLPFFEPWDGGSLGYNLWTNGSNWSYNTMLGNPAPSADFTWQPILTNYTSSLVTTWIDASAWTCAAIYLDFDYKLDSRDTSGSEKMDIDVMWANKWNNKAELTNHAGSINWSSKHIDISGAKGQGLQVRFRANGNSSQHIINWFIDNVHVYGVCSRPISLNNTQSHDTINLTWDPPKCGPSGQVMCFLYDDGTMEDGLYFNPGYTEWAGNLFPLAASVTGAVQSFDVLWWNNASATIQPFQIDVFSQAGVLLGSSQTWTVPNPAPTSFMTIILNTPIPFAGAFYGMVKWSNFTGATHFLGMDQNGPYVNSNIGMWYDGTTWNNASALGYGACVWTVRTCAFINNEDRVVKLGPFPTPSPTQVTVAPGVAVAVSPGPGVSIDSYDHPTMNLGDNSSDSSLLIGYNVFRYDSVQGGVVHFRKLNTATQSATAYQDVVGLSAMQYGTYMYYVTAVFNNSLNSHFLCESPASDTVTIQFPAVGIPEVSGGSIMIYPNPANDVVNVKSDFNISRIEVLNFIGQTVYSENTVNSKLVKINTSSLQTGVYFVKVTTSKGLRMVKITVVR